MDEDSVLGVLSPRGLPWPSPAPHTACLRPSFVPCYTLMCIVALYLIGMTFSRVNGKGFSFTACPSVLHLIYTQPSEVDGSHLIWQLRNLIMETLSSLPPRHTASENQSWYSISRSAAAKSLQSCLTLCDPIDGSPPGSPVPGILQAKTLEWDAISFSNAWKWKVKVKSLSRIWPSATPWTAAYQALPSMGFSRQKYWSGVPLPSPISRSALI